MRVAPRSLATVAALAAAGCGATMQPHPSTPAARASIGLSSDFKPGASIPPAHTCDGQDVSPPLRVVGLVVSTKELVVVMRDPDAPGGDFIHWAMADIIVPRGARSMFLLAGARPNRVVLGRNSFGSLGYRGPCPPAGGAPHHYRITVYALGRTSMLTSGFSADAVARLPALATGSLTGLYARR